MRFLSHFSMAVALATAGTLAITALPQDAQAAKKKKEKKPAKVQFSKEFSAAAGPVQTAVNDADPQAKALVEQLLAGPWTGADADFAGQLAINLGSTLKDTKLQEDGVNKRIEAGMLAPADNTKMLFYSGSFARGRGDYAAAEKQLLAAIAGGYEGSAAHLELANTYASLKSHAKSLHYLGQAIEIQNATGSAAPEDWYRASRDRAFATSDKALYAQWAAKWAEAYPSPESWSDAITAYRYKKLSNTEENLEVLRFMKASGALTKFRDYKEYAEEANKKNNFGEIVDVLEDGRLKGVIEASNPIVSELLVPNKGKITGDRASLPTSPGSVRGSGSASVMMNYGDIWFGYEDYAKATVFYEAGMAKSGADMDRGNIGVGTVKAFAGDLAGAKAAFDKVNGTRAPLAKLWKAWIGQQNKPAAPAAVAAEPAT
jgi:tetratricopeptide (TPR) repeat protein